MLIRKKIIFYVIIGVLIAMCTGNVLWAQYVTSTLPPPPPPPDTRPSAQQQKTPKIDLHFNVKPTIPRSYEDVQGMGEYSADLKTPSNITSVVEFDPETGCYVVHTRLGDYDIVTPYIMSPDDFSNADFRRSMMEYYRQKNAESAQDTEKDPFNFLDMQFGMGPLETVFGPGGVQLKTTGSLIINMGVKSTTSDRPITTQSSVNDRRKTYFDFEQKIEANINATVGDKMRFNMTYNTAATFDFDSKNLKLAYEGKEDEIIKNIEAGNVSMTTGSSLIRGSAALFGIKTKLQFGKLTATALVSQQNSETQTVNGRGGSQTTEFTISADKYDQNRNFFLSHYFRDNYDTWCSTAPLPLSGIKITRIEVWKTNKSRDTNGSRNIMAFMDLGEWDYNHISNHHWQGKNNTDSYLPQNRSNTLYEEITDSAYQGARYVATASSALEQLATNYGFEGGKDYEKIESARLLPSSDYVLNEDLGYIMLKTELGSDEILAVAYEYTCGGRNYKVGEFSDQTPSKDQSLYLKMLKGTTSSPSLGEQGDNPMWDLAMKNVYSLGAYPIQSSNFKLNIKYLSDTTGNDLIYIPAGDINGVPLLQVMNLDRLDANQQPNIDGRFDYLERYTISSRLGKIIFPVVEPFGEHLREMINNDSIAKNYVYTELYDSTLTVARQFSDKNKFTISGEYQTSSSGNVYHLNATNVAPGSVTVKAGGETLNEFSDYIVDYTMGTVTIMNQSYIDAGADISITLENQSTFSMQRKTLLGLDLDYAFNKNFHIGGTVMHYGERAIGDKVAIGSELVNNTIWGVNMNYNGQFMWLTNLLNKIPTVNAVAPSSISFLGEFAQLVPHQAKTGSNSGSSYIDDFESTQQGLDIRSRDSWFLASTPYDPAPNALFPEAAKSNDLEYGKNRALLSWYTIDRLFTQSGSTFAPGYIRSDDDALMYPYAREVAYSEVFPGRQLNYGESSVIQTLNLSFYPCERGPYNVVADVTNVEPDGSLKFPEKRWGGIMRKLDNTNFEQSNIEYIQFWMLDPFMRTEELGNEDGGYLYFNLGEISEDILKDGLKSYEDGLPVNDSTAYVTETVWGKVSTKTTTTSYGFDNTNGARPKQDVGLDGLSDDEERQHPTYSQFLSDLRGVLSDSTYTAMQEDPFSPFNDPAGDNYSFYRRKYYDDNRYTINERYKHYNGTDGNSLINSDVDLYMASRSQPDVEDINQDFTLNEYERYFQYRVAIHPDSLKVGMNYVTDKRVAHVHRHNREQEATWYQFTIPLADYKKKVGTIQDFSSIRFMRIFMTGFKATTHLRFASLELVRGEWRDYKFNLNLRGDMPANGSVSINKVNIEENASREPVNYVLPPGVSRIIDSGQSQIRQINEQSMQLSINDLDAGEAHGVYRNTDLDLRVYKRLQMYVHAEATVNNETNLRNGDVSLFVRLGSDVKNNYYEYEIPLTVTPPGSYSNSEGDRLKVWPSENMLDINLDALVNTKKNRNADKMAGIEGVGYNNRYQGIDDEHPNNKIYVMGNPSLSKVRVMLIGVRNNSPTTKNCVVWVDELRVTDFDSEGGWAAKTSMTLNMSDIATVNMGFHKETEGFGSVDQSLSNRRLDNYDQYSLAVQTDFGRFLPEKVKLHAPVYYSYTNERILPKYNPLDQDVKLNEAVEICETEHQKDSIMDYAVTQRTSSNFSISGLKFDVKTMKNPMPWDPTNFTFSYSFSKLHLNDPDNVYENTNDYRGSMQYSWTPYSKPFKPFSHFIDEKNKNMKFFRDWELRWLPTNLSFGTNIARFYYEQQTRDETGMNIQLPVAVSKTFDWDRQFVLTWAFTKSLSASFNSNTKAHIEEPFGQVNRKLHPNDYRDWRDSVMSSIRGLGTPWNYNQKFIVSYKAPLNQIPILAWITANANYESTYKWDRGTTINGITSGNTIYNQTTRSFDGRLNFEQFYSKIPYLKKVDERFSSKSTKRTGKQQPKKEKPKKFSRTFKLSPDSAIIINHKLGVKNVKVTATTTDDKPFKIEYKVKDKDNVEITTLGEENLKFNIIEVQKEERHNFFTEAAEYTSRLLMSLRNVSLRWKYTTTLSIPQFKPEIGDIFGQSLRYDAMSPGLDFAFGLVGQSYIEKAKNNGWLLGDGNQTTPAIYSYTNEFNAEVLIEPIAGLKITLTGNRTDKRDSQIQFMFDDPSIIYGGSYIRTHVAIATAFRSSDARDNYRCETFDQFLNNVDIIANRIQQRYMGTTYPDRGFLRDADVGLAGRTYSMEYGAVNRSSSDVLIPAFLAAYSGKDPAKIDLNPFPGFKAILPNWRVTYDGLMRIPFFKKLFKGFNLNHTYKCTYTVGSFNSFSDWVTIGDGLGFTQNELTRGAIPSSPYNISSVEIKEEFVPLIGFTATFFNDISLKLQYDMTRKLTLNSSAGQLIEVLNKGFTLGGSYKIANFNQVLKLKTKQQNVSNDLTLDLNIKMANTPTIMRTFSFVNSSNTEDSNSNDASYFEYDARATSGSRTWNVDFKANYVVSKRITIGAYFDYQSNTPLVNRDNQYSTTSTNYGLTINMSLVK